jgi:hypothetical protein
MHEFIAAMDDSIGKEKEFCLSNVAVKSAGFRSLSKSLDLQCGVSSLNFAR